MEKQQPVFKRKELVLAVSMAVLVGTMSGCSSDSDSKDSVVGGNYTLSTAGGNGGVTAYGGDGGEVDLYLYGGTGGVNVKRSGAADTAFTSQISKITPFYGVNPLAISSTTTIPLAPLYNSVAEGGVTVAATAYVGTDGVMRTAAGVTAAYATDPMVTDGTLYRWSGNTNELYTATGDDTTADLAAAGTPYLRINDTTLRTADGDDTVADPAVTGISIAKGATLTLDNNYNSGAMANVYLQNDLVNHGTLTTADANATDRGDLQLYVASLISDGTLDTSGSGTVLNGGYIDIWSDYSTINSGVITTAGADNAAGNGGQGGYIDLESYYYTENSGALSSNGGNSTGGIGGTAAYVYLYSEYGSARNSGDINASGGSGDVGGGGNWVGLYNDAAGGVLNSGDITTSGGSGSAGSGGSAGSMDFYAYGGRLASSGALTAIGGDAAADFNAGSGGYVYLYSSTGYSSWDYGTTPQGSIELSGNITLDGGNSSGAGNGGNAGYLEADTDNDGNGNEDTAGDQAITLLGYSTIDTTGGDGQYPGEGGYIDLYANYGLSSATYTYVTGPVSNAADIIASAGALTGTGDTGSFYARGGDITLETSYYYGALNPKTLVTNTGDITSNGADGRNATSTNRLEAGGIWMWGYNGVNNSGTITLNGGNDLADDGGIAGAGGGSGWVELYAELGPVVNSGAITVNGGNGEYMAGYGSSWTALYGPTVKNSGKISAAGGTFDLTLNNPGWGGEAGYGGWVWMMGSEGPKDVSSTGTITLTPGATYSAWVEANPTTTMANGYYKVIGAHCEGDC
jgi:hypothetical protein